MHSLQWQFADRCSAQLAVAECGPFNAQFPVGVCIPSQCTTCSGRLSTIAGHDLQCFSMLADQVASDREVLECAQASAEMREKVRICLLINGLDLK